MTYALVFWACLGGDCREIRIPWDGSLMQCVLFGQQLVAAWTNDHPRWEPRRGYRCDNTEAL